MSGRGTIQEALLDALTPGLCLAVEDLQRATKLPRKEIPKAACKLIHKGLIERVEMGCYRLTEKGQDRKQSGDPITSGPNGPLTGQRHRKRDFRTRVWRAMATLNKFTIRDLAAVAVQGNEKDAIGNCGKFLAVLARAGYVRRLPRRQADGKTTSSGLIVYLRLRHTGPQAPRVRRDGLYDPNTGELMPWSN